MDPLSVLSLTSTIVQFIDFGFKVTKRLTDYAKAGIDDIPQTLETIATQLPLLLNALERVKANLADSKLDYDTRCILKGVVAGCMVQLGKVDKIMDKVLCVAGGSKAVRIRKAVKSLGTDDKLAAIEKDLQTYISVLILHHVIDDSVAAPMLTAETTYFEVPIERVSPFYDRDDLMEKIDLHLDDVKTSQVASPVSVAFYGKAGVGKTQLALEYCHRTYRLGHFKPVFSLNASTPQTLAFSLRNATTIVRRSKEGSDLEKLNFIQKFLSERWHPWLLILDGYNEAKFDDVFDLLPESGCGAYLFTTDTSKAPMLDNVIEVPKFLTLNERKGLQIQLSNAIEIKDTENALRMISLGADANSVTMIEWPCINRAALHGMTEVVRALLDKGADPKLKATISGEGGWTALYWAATNGHTSIVKMVLDHEDRNLTVWEAPGYNSPMLAAAENGHADALRLILDRRKVQIESTKHQWTALEMAARKGHTSVVELLLERGADPANGQSLPLAEAVQNGYYGTARTIIKTCSQGRFTITSTDLCEALISLPMSTEKDKHPEEVESMGRYLLELGACPNGTPGRQGPLHTAAQKGLKSLTRLLLENGAQPLLKDGNHHTPLDVAISLGKEDVSELLNLEIQDSAVREQYLIEALCSAIVRGHSKRDMALLLLQAGANVNGKIKNGRTPLIRSIECSEVSMARLLVRHGARADISDANGDLPLTLAASKGYHLLVRDIVQSGKAPDEKDSSGSTALCIAAARGHKDVVQVLMDGRANKHLTNKYGETALDLAEENRHKEIVKLLKSH